MKAKLLHLTGLLMACSGTVLALLFTGCATRAYHSNGQPWFTTYSNAAQLSATSGGETFSIIGLDNSGPTRAAMLGTNRILATVGGAAVAIAIPGSGAVPLVGRAAIATVPSFTTPATPSATPAPKGAAAIWP